MKDLSAPLDKNILIRWLHLHCFIHMFRVFSAKDASAVFSQPRFEMFRQLRRICSSKTTSHSLFKNLLYTYKQEIGVGLLVTTIFACLNLLVPQLIRSFLTEMSGYGLKKIKVDTNSYFTQQFMLLQFLRLIFGQHSRRLFTELAIKVESTLSKRLVEKSLRMARQMTDRIPQSQIYQLQNVDLKLIFNLFRNMHLCFQAPITVVGALVLIFLESPSYGIIAIYWFVIAFLLQRELDGRMTHCNQTKLQLIDKRSQVNYQIFRKIKAAKLSGCESLLTEKNNDLFIEENHDHELYYYYSSLYDITLLLLPIMVVVTIALFDIGEVNPITVEEVYVMLSLLQICYNPMKAFQTLVISFHDGMHSLNRLTSYFGFPDEIDSALVTLKPESQPLLHIKKNTISAYPHLFYDFLLVINTQVDLKGGERLLVIGKKGQGISSFMHMLVGSMKKVKGNVSLYGKIGYLPDKFHFACASVRDNIAFYNKDVTDQQIRQIYNKLGLKDEIKAADGLSIQMNAETSFTPSQLQRISLARVFCSKSDVYILDNPFCHLSPESASIVQSMLRDRQQQGIMIIIASKHAEFAQSNDQILILDVGVSVEYGTFGELNAKSESRIKKFLHSKETDDKDTDSKSLAGDVVQFKKKIIGQFRKRIQRAVSVNRTIDTNDKDDTSTVRDRQIRRTYNHTSIDTFNAFIQKKLQIVQKDKIKKQHSFLRYLYTFLTAAAPSEIILIYLIIISAELLHIFIHFFIGHEYEEHQNNDLSSFRNLMIIELVLTIGLAGIVYLQGQVSSKLAVIKGNTLHSRSLENLTERSLVWFNQQFSVKLANKFNHDYEQVFIAWHCILAIYKNVIILLATIMFVSSNKQNVIIITSLIAIVYLSVLAFLRSVQTKVIHHYYDYKYQFVRIFEESVTANEIIKIHNVKKQFLKRAEQKYMKLAAYKLAESYTAYGEELLCDLISIVLLGFAFQYGFEMKGHGRSTAVIATTIFLLINLSQVLKTIVKLTVNLQTFFALNMEPFMEFGMKKDSVQKTNDLKKNVQPASNLIKYTQSSQSQIQVLSSNKYDIVFRDIVFQYHPSVGSINDIQKNRFSIQIPSGEKILLLETNQAARQYLLYALTRNLPQFRRPWVRGEGILEIGGRKINDISTDDLRGLVGVITDDNFFINATLKDNVGWKVNDFDDIQVDRMARQLKIQEDFQNYSQTRLSSLIETVDGKINRELNKKIAILRILCLKPKIILIKNTDFIVQRSIAQFIRSYLPNCTIIKISNKIQVSFDVDRIVLMENLKIKEQGRKDQLVKLPTSAIAKLLSQSNIAAYKYIFQTSVSPRKPKSRTSLVG